METNNTVTISTDQFRELIESDTELAMLLEAITGTMKYDWNGPKFDMASVLAVVRTIRPYAYQKKVEQLKTEYDTEVKASYARLKELEAKAAEAADKGVA